MRIKYSKKSIGFFITLIISLSAVFVSCNKENKNEVAENKSDKPIVQTQEKAVEKNGTDTSSNFYIQYNLQGRNSGKLEIMRNGNKFRESINFERTGSQGNNEVYIIDGIIYTSIKMGNKKFGQKNSVKNQSDSSITGETITDFIEFEKFLGKAKITGSEVILNYKCDIYELRKNARVSVYNKKYILKIDSPVIFATATEFKTDTLFYDSVFKLPTDIEFSDVSQKIIVK